MQAGDVQVGDLVMAIGNPYGGMSGPVGAPHGVVGSTGIGGGSRAGSNAGVTGKVASAGIPSAVTAAPVQQVAAAPVFTNLEVLSKPPVEYTPEARQLRIQGEVVLRVTKGETDLSRAEVWSRLMAIPTCKAWCMDWATAWMNRRAAWPSRYASVPPPETDRR